MQSYSAKLIHTLVITDACESGPSFLLAMRGGGNDLDVHGRRLRLGRQACVCFIELSEKILGSLAAIATKQPGLDSLAAGGVDGPNVVGELGGGPSNDKGDGDQSFPATQSESVIGHEASWGGRR